MIGNRHNNLRAFEMKIYIYIHIIDQKFGLVFDNRSIPLYAIILFNFSIIRCNQKSDSKLTT